MANDHGTCPYLGLEFDSSVRLSYADSGHSCFALPQKGQIRPDLEHQTRFCLVSSFPACPNFQTAEKGDRAPEPASPPAKESSSVPWWQLALWAIALLAAIGVVWRLTDVLAQPDTASQDTQPVTQDTTPVPGDETPADWPTPDPAYVAAAIVDDQSPTPEPMPQTTPKLLADETLVSLVPEQGAVGWVGSQQANGSNLGDSYLHAGIVQGEIFYGILQFDLSRLKRGAPVRQAALLLTGLDDKRLNMNGNGSWQARWLDPEINERWSRQAFQDFHNATILQSLLPAVGPTELSPLVPNKFVFNDDQVRSLEQAIYDESYLVAFRLDGPLTTSSWTDEDGNLRDEDLFSWDSGYGPATRGNSPVLQLVMGSAPATPPAVPTRDLIVVTSTPTPENVLTVAAQLHTATAIAVTTGTPTPTPRAMVTATPTPVNEATARADRFFLGLPLVITETPTPANVLTATMIAMLQTAEAFTTGTPTPLPEGYIMATPTPTFVVITNTPTAQSARELLDRTIIEATRTATAGPPTEIPVGVATATPTPTGTPLPLNQTTVEARILLQTVEALTIGTWTPTPTATWTPTATPSPTPAADGTSQPTVVVPEEPESLTVPIPEPTRVPLGSTLGTVAGKLLFLSDRLGETRIFAIDSDCVYSPEGCGNVQADPLVQETAYILARDQQSLDIGGSRRVIVQLDARGVPQLAVVELDSHDSNAITSLEGAAYDPAWSPVDDLIVFVSNDPGNDEIFTIAADGSGETRLTNVAAFDKHPTWSPDGQTIVFYSDRAGDRRQLWVMNADGSQQRNISNNQFNDWDPIWVE
ncbi:MAG: hypothetical protein U9R25_20205 [Chloroflexota bacterium]|nr:hypothetical protein [Chloroflexota bacterium]